MRPRLLVALVPFLLTTGTACSHYRPPKTLDVARFGDTVAYFGPLTPEGLDRLKAADAGDARTLLIRSGGGEVGIGIDFGNWVRDRRLDVVVYDYCMSSCANYVFVAGIRKWIPPGAVVAWHGSARDARVADAPASQRETVRQYIQKVQPSEVAFYERIGVKESLPTVGNHCLSANGFATMSVEDMARFGVTDIMLGPHDERDLLEPWRSLASVRFVRIPPSLNLERC